MPGNQCSQLRDRQDPLTYANVTDGAIPYHGKHWTDRALKKNAANPAQTALSGRENGRILHPADSGRGFLNSMRHASVFARYPIGVTGAAPPSASQPHGRGN